MNGWSYGGTVKANKHWQSGKKKSFTFDLLRPDTWPNIQTASKQSSVVNDNKTVQPLGWATYGYLFQTGLTGQGLGVYDYISKDFSIADKDGVSNAVRYFFVSNHGFIKKVDTVPGKDNGIMTVKMKILSLPNEWKKATVYLISFGGYNTVCFNCFNGTESVTPYWDTYNMDTTNTQKNTTALATKDIQVSGSKAQTSFKIMEGDTFGVTYTLDTQKTGTFIGYTEDLVATPVTINYWSSKIGIGFLLTSLFFIADGHETAEESLTGTFKVQFEYTEYEAS